MSYIVCFHPAGPDVDRHASRQHAFTLIELSIVLVIIGLIVGGVLTGRDLINTAENRAVVTQTDAFKTATAAFRLKYNCLPGDCQNATAFFGTTAPGGVSDGDGNREITSTSYGAPINEMVEFWRHLGKAGMVAGNYRGYANLEGTSLLISPEGKKSGLDFLASYQPDPIYGIVLGNTIMLRDELAASPWNGPILRPADARYIDTKLDDGAPSSGGVLAVPGTSLSYTQCSTTDPASGASTGAYALSSAALGCMMYMKLGF